MAFLCGPRNPWTAFNAARSYAYAEKVDEVRREHMPMLRWVAETAGARIGRGRIALLENGWESEALRLPCFQKLIDTPDAVQWTRGDQCMLGQKDAVTGLPFHASTAWPRTVFASETR